jgi:hypothetical protein
LFYVFVVGGEAARSKHTGSIFQIDTKLLRLLFMV